MPPTDNRLRGKGGIAAASRHAAEIPHLRSSSATNRTAAGKFMNNPGYPPSNADASVGHGTRLYVTPASEAGAGRADAWLLPAWPHAHDAGHVDKGPRQAEDDGMRLEA